MKIIKGFEGEDIVVSDFVEWVGNNYIDYKFEYKNNQKIIKGLLKENENLEELIKDLRKAIGRKEETIFELIHERVPYTNQYVNKVIQKLQKYKELINLFLDKVNKNKMILNNPDILDVYLKIKEMSE